MNETQFKVGDLVKYVRNGVGFDRGIVVEYRHSVTGMWVKIYWFRKGEVGPRGAHSNYLQLLSRGHNNE